MKITVAITNTYPRIGRSRTYILTASVAPLNSDLDDWMSDELLPLTGEGTACSREHAVYTVEILKCGDSPTLVGGIVTSEG
ncbi:MAG: hypothetical protein ACTH1D_08130 [Mycobacteriaceae bacterium]|uniref:hypothetical protein n=1 Tax=Corynebacterium sp. TaxID=1720 RepID=UPI003F95B0E3